MGMDVYGNAPRDERGKYFRANVWWWRPLARYMRDMAPEITTPCTHWDTNEGGGLNDSDSRALAQVLRAELARGRTAAYAKEYEDWQASLPAETCDLCEGTGIRKPVPERGAGDPAAGGTLCNACHGAGKERPFAAWYLFDPELRRGVRDLPRTLRRF